MKPLVVLEFNEVNFDYIQNYISRGHLKNFSKFIEKYGIAFTKSESKYEYLEPWIQWVSAHTGKKYADHGIFRLGDMVNSDIVQHWEVLERQGFTVAAISPINAVNRTNSSPFWIPDPWTNTITSGDKTLLALSKVLKQAVNDNASEKIEVGSILTLFKAFFKYSSIRFWPCWIFDLIGALKKQHWSKAILFDRLISDIFFKSWNQHKPNFSTIFLNGAAHIQHHYLFNSPSYSGDQRNPSWYISQKKDPVLEVYELYDSILSRAIKLDARVIVATGLRQVPYHKNTYYYRLKNHEKFLEKLSVDFEYVEPRMSRDFLVHFDSSEKAKESSVFLSSLKAEDGSTIFSVDLRGYSIFVTLKYDMQIEPCFKIVDDIGKCVIEDLYPDVVFVAIKNGHHDSLGYYLDSSLSSLPNKPILLESLFNIILDHFGVSGS